MVMNGVIDFPLQPLAIYSHLPPPFSLPPTTLVHLSQSMLHGASAPCITVSSILHHAKPDFRAYLEACGVQRAT